MSSSSLDVQLMAMSEDAPTGSGRPSCRAHVTYSTVPMPMVVPANELTGPATRIIEIGKAIGRILRSILRRAEQRLHERVIVAHARPRVRRLDPQPVQHRQHRRGLHGCAVVTVKHRFLGQSMDAFGQSGWA